MNSYDVIIIGAGAAGLMCAIEAGKRGRSVWLIDHMAKFAEKIRISGGGRCNFTNIFTQPQHYLSQNPHFCKSALAQFTPHDFINLVNKHHIAFHEKKLGQLFCDHSSQQIIDMLLSESHQAKVSFALQTRATQIEALVDGYRLDTNRGIHTCRSLVIATGGLSIPKIGASNFGYEVAKKFDINVIKPRPGLVPLTFDGALLEQCKSLSGVSIDATVQFNRQSFSEGLLFTHRGLSGPSILQISSYWEQGKAIRINLIPDIDLYSLLKAKKNNQPKLHIGSVLAEQLPKRLAQNLCDQYGFTGAIGILSDRQLAKIAEVIQAWLIWPTGTEGYRKAEVTIGGVDTNELSSRTLEAKKRPGLYFIGEVVDVTGHLGGFNFQWAWSSGFAAGQSV